MHMSLQQRFESFLSQLVGSENIDQIDIIKKKNGVKKADYFLDNRKVIVELKNIVTDLDLTKADKVLEEYRPQLIELPIYSSIETVLDHLPKHKPQERIDILQKISDKNESFISASIEAAHRQIRSTKDFFQLENSCGLLIIFDEKQGVLAPESIIQRATRLLEKRDSSGALRHPEIQCILYICEALKATTFLQSGDVSTFPIIAITGPTVEHNSEIGEFVDTLVERWSKYDDVHLIASTQEELESLNFQREGDNDKPPFLPKEIKEFWSNQYSFNRYLKSLTNLELAERLRDILLEARLRMSLRKSSKEIGKEISRLLELQEHFNQEIIMRGLDLRTLDKYK